MVIFAVDRVQLDIAQRIVHPAHVPLEAEPQAAQIGGLGDVGKGGRLLRDGHHTRKVAVDRLVKTLQKGDGIKVFIAAVLVGQPFIFPAEIVVEHRAHRVAAQAVNVIIFKPETGVADQKAADLAPCVVKEHGAPLGHLAAAGIRVLIAGRAVKAAQAYFIPRKMGGHPVEDDTDFSLVQHIDKEHKVLRAAVTGRRGKVTCHLIAPGHIQRMFHHRQQLHMRVAHVLDVGDQQIRDLGVAEHGPVFMPSPAAQVHLVDIDRAFISVPAASPLHPALIAPDIAIQRAKPAGCIGPKLTGKSVGVSFQVHVAVKCIDCILIAAQLLRGIGIAEALRISVCVKLLGGQPELPYAVILLLHREAKRIPGTEFASQVDGARVGCPHGKVPVILAILRDRMRAQQLIGLPADPLMEGTALYIVWGLVLHGNPSHVAVYPSASKHNPNAITCIQYSISIYCSQDANDQGQRVMACPKRRKIKRDAASRLLIGSVS